MCIARSWRPSAGFFASNLRNLHEKQRKEYTMNHLINILRSKDLEISEKYLFLFLINEKEREFKASLLADMLGISVGMLYRARSLLVKRGLLQLSKKFCSETGKRISDIYELVQYEII